MTWEGEYMHNDYNAGDIVYIFYRNPHIQDVANIQEAAVVNSPDNPNELALFLFETYYPLTNDLVVFASEMDAEQAYHQYFH
ncbi:transcriptional regulator SplA domain-containing protein [Lysinibacillus sphaericus]|uniref:transcriptional regulator SplA domain-containing protein n=1 Tax=Lysinibacillus sphaericus TaxID=1421 RepID=UPI003F7B1A2B